MPALVLLLISSWQQLWPRELLTQRVGVMGQQGDEVLKEPRETAFVLPAWRGGTALRSASAQRQALLLSRNFAPCSKRLSHTNLGPGKCDMVKISGLAVVG